jgi:ribose/xylose/arabinose/galactoside ABC-type transport system permease subunit
MGKYGQFYGRFFNYKQLNNLNGIDPVFQRIIQGLVILLAVGADSIRSTRQT